MPVDNALAEHLTIGAITVAVRRLAGNPDLDVTSWTHEPVAWTIVSEATGSLQRVSGLAQGKSGQVAWSLVLKTSRQPGGEAANEAYAWQREALVYTSGLVKPDSGFALPRLLHVTEPREREVGLWLEDVPDLSPEVWEVETHAQVAYHLGVFNGSHRLSLAAAPPWLMTDWLSWWVSAGAAQQARDLAFVRRKATWQHPAVRTAFPNPVLERLEFLVEHSASLAAAVERLPQALCHMDAGRFNLRRPEAAGNKTVFLDWQSLSLGPLGTDLAMTNFLNLCRFYARPEEAERLDEQTFAAYASGLRSVGVDTPANEVRLAYTTTAALRTAVVVRLLVENLVTDQARQTWVSQWGARLGLSYDQALEAWGTAMRYLLGLGKEAVALAPS